MDSLNTHTHTQSSEFYDSSTCIIAWISETLFLSQGLRVGCLPCHLLYEPEQDYYVTECKIQQCVFSFGEGSIALSSVTPGPPQSGRFSHLHKVVSHSRENICFTRIPVYTRLLFSLSNLSESTGVMNHNLWGIFGSSIVQTSDCLCTNAVNKGVELTEPWHRAVSK